MEQLGEWVPAAIRTIKDFAVWLAGFAPHPYWVFFCGIGLVALWIVFRRRKR